MKRLRLIANVASGVITLLALVSLLCVTLLPSVLGYKTYTVLSGSMEPAIHTGSVLMAVTVPPENLKVGDVIVYNRSDVNERVTHRIVEIKQEGGKPVFTTKGDANGAPDSWTVRYQGDTAGKIVAAVPFVGYLYHGLSSPQGRLVFLVVPVMVLSMMWLWQIWKPQITVERREVEVPKGIAPEPPAPAPPSVSTDSDKTLGQLSEPGASISLRQ